MDNIKTLDFDFSEGISVLRFGKVFEDGKDYLISGSQKGELKIIDIPDNIEEDDFEVVYQFDLSDNGAIWALETQDVNNDGKEEILVGGMNGAFLCLSGRGEEVWEFDNVVHRCGSSISGIKVWKNSPLQEKNPDDAPIIVVFSLDKSIRVLAKDGHMLWSQMFSSGVGTIAFGDTNGNGREEIIGGGNDGTIRIFDGITGKLLWFKEMGYNIRSLDCTENQEIMCGGDNRKIQIIDGKSQEIERERAFPTYVWQLKNLGNFILTTTYSFNYLGMNDPSSGEPSIGLYDINSLEPIWEHVKFNCQDYCIINKDRNLVAADTDGNIAYVNLKKEPEIQKHQVPDLINTIICRKEESTGNLSIFTGCDDKKIYYEQIKNPNYNKKNNY